VQNFNLNPDSFSCWSFWGAAEEPALPFATSMMENDGGCFKMERGNTRQFRKGCSPRSLYGWELAAVQRYESVNTAPVIMPISDKKRNYKNYHQTPANAGLQTAPIKSSQRQRERGEDGGKWLCSYLREKTPARGSAMFSSCMVIACTVCGAGSVPTDAWGGGRWWFGEALRCDVRRSLKCFSANWSRTWQKPIVQSNTAGRDRHSIQNVTPPRAHLAPPAFQN
jgi:hypothetical protein